MSETIAYNYVITDDIYSTTNAPNCMDVCDVNIPHNVDDEAYINSSIFAVVINRLNIIGGTRSISIPNES